MEAALTKLAGVLLAVGVFLVLNKHYQQRRFSTEKYLAGIKYTFAFAAVVLLFDRLAAVSGGGLSLQLAERIEQKADRVQLLAIRVAQLAAFNANLAVRSSVMSWDGPTMEELLTVRSNAVNALKESPYTGQS